MTSKQPKLFSLRRTFFLLLVFCIIVPFLLVVSLSGLISYRSHKQYVEEIVTSVIDGTIDTIRREFDGLVDESISASYTSTIRDAYSAYLDGGSANVFYSTLQTYLQEHYSRNYRVSAAFLVFEDVPLIDPAFH